MSQKRPAKKNPKLEDKLSKLKERQDKWMQERATTSTPNKKLVHSSLRSYDSTATTTTSAKEAGRVKKKTTDVKKQEAVLWTTGSNKDYNGFVVRNGSGTSSRPNSARTPASKKTFTHSSLRDQLSKSNNPTSAKSSNFEQSKQVTDREKQVKSEKETLSDEDNHDFDDDESLSSSFQEHFSKLQMDQDYNHNKYKVTNDENNENIKSVEIKSNKKIGDTTQCFMENHYCLICKQLMFEDHHIPQMVFPCGHSFCSNCILGKGNCPSCKCKIISIEQNDTLYRIIQQFKRKQEKEKLEYKEKQVRKYLEEYKVFNTRIDIMKGEATGIIDHMEGITHQLIEKQDSLKNIKRTAADIKKQRELLQQQIKSLENRHEQETSEINNLESDYDKQKNQLKMLQRTIMSIEQNKEDVKQLVGELSSPAVALLEELDRD